MDSSQGIYRFEPTEVNSLCVVCGRHESHTHHLEEVPGLMGEGLRLPAVYLYRQITGKGFAETMVDLAPYFEQPHS